MSDDLQPVPEHIGVERECMVPLPWMHAGRVTWPMREAICDWIADGRPLREFCQLNNAPSYGQVRRWLRMDFDFAQEFDDAVAAGREALLEETIAIADRRNVLDEEDIKHRTLQISTRMQVLEKSGDSRFSGRGNGNTGDVSITVVTGVPAPEQVKQLPQPRLELDG